MLHHCFALLATTEISDRRACIDCTRPIVWYERNQLPISAPGSNTQNWVNRCFITVLPCSQQLRYPTHKRSESRQIGLRLPTLLHHLKFSTRSRSLPE